jgi:hypothetical protein
VDEFTDSGGGYVPPDDGSQPIGNPGLPPSPDDYTIPQNTDDNSASYESQTSPADYGGALGYAGPPAPKDTTPSYDTQQTDSPAIGTAGLPAYGSSTADYGDQTDWTPTEANAYSSRKVAENTIDQADRQNTAAQQQNDDIQQRWQNYYDSVTQGGVERDPQFEASINGEWQDYLKNAGQANDATGYAKSSIADANQYGQQYRDYLGGEQNSLNADMEGYKQALEYAQGDQQQQVQQAWQQAGGIGADLLAGTAPGLARWQILDGSGAGGPQEGPALPGDQSDVLAAASDPNVRGFVKDANDPNASWRPFTNDEADQIQQQANAGLVTLAPKSSADAVAASQPRPGGTDAITGGQIVRTVGALAMLPVAELAPGAFLGGVQATLGADDLVHGIQDKNWTQALGGAVNIATAPFLAKSFTGLADIVAEGANAYRLGIVAPEYADLVSQGGIKIAGRELPALLTRPTIGQAVSFALVNGANIPFTETAIPGTGHGVLQHPIGGVVDLAEHLKNAVLTGAFVQAVTSRADWQDAGDAVLQSLHQDETTYARQQGLQQMVSQVDPLMGANWRIQAAVTLAELTLPHIVASYKGQGDGGSFFGDPFATFSTRFDGYIRQGMAPAEAAQQAFSSLQNGISTALWTYNPRNPLWNWMRSPLLEEAGQQAFSGFGRQIVTPKQYLEGDINLVNRSLLDRLIGPSKQSAYRQIATGLDAFAASVLPASGAGVNAFEMFTDAVLAELRHDYPYADQRYAELGRTYGALAPNVAGAAGTADGGWRAHAQLSADGIRANMGTITTAKSIEQAGLAWQKDVSSILRGAPASPRAIETYQRVQKELLQNGMTPDQVMREAALSALSRPMRDGLRLSLGLPILDRPGNLAATIQRGYDVLLRTPIITQIAPALGLTKTYDEFNRSLFVGNSGIRAGNTAIGARLGADTSADRLARVGVPLPDYMMNTDPNNRDVFKIFGQKWGKETGPLLRGANTLNDTVVAKTTTHQQRGNFEGGALAFYNEGNENLANEYASKIFNAINPVDPAKAQEFANRLSDLFRNPDPADPTRAYHLNQLADEMDRWHAAVQTGKVTPSGPPSPVNAAYTTRTPAQQLLDRILGRVAPVHAWPPEMRGIFAPKAMADVPAFVDAVQRVAATKNGASEDFLNAVRQNLHVMQRTNPAAGEALRQMDATGLRATKAATMEQLAAKYPPLSDEEMGNDLARQAGARQQMGGFRPRRVRTPTQHLAPGTEVGAGLRPFEAPAGAETGGYDGIGIPGANAAEAERLQRSNPQRGRTFNPATAQKGLADTPYGDLQSLTDDLRQMATGQAADQWQYRQARGQTENPAIPYATTAPPMGYSGPPLGLPQGTNPNWNPGALGGPTYPGPLGAQAGPRYPTYNPAGTRLGGNTYGTVAMGLGGPPPAQHGPNLPPYFNFANPADIARQAGAERTRLLQGSYASGQATVRRAIGDFSIFVPIWANWRASSTPSPSSTSTRSGAT